MSNEDIIGGDGTSEGESQPSPQENHPVSEFPPPVTPSLREVKLAAVLSAVAPHLDIESEIRHVAGLTMSHGRVAGEPAYRPPAAPLPGGPAAPQGANSGGIDWSTATPSQIVTEVEKRVALNTIDSNLI